MVVKCFGGRGPLCQVERIEQGLILEGHTLCSDNGVPDFIYSNDPGYYDEALRFKEEKAPNAKVIFNVLDIPEANFPPQGDYSFEKLHNLGEMFKRADAVTVISHWVQSQLQRFFGIGSYVIYNPIKDVTPNREERVFPYSVLLAGRVNDPNKRIRNLAIPALIQAGFSENEVAVVGGEWPGWGVSLGIVDDVTLNKLYNSVDFTVCTTLLGGLELVIPESMICGSVPIVCSDLTTVSEFPIPKYWQCYPGVMSLAARLYRLRNNPEELERDRNYCLSIGEGVVEKFRKEKIAQNILNVCSKIV